MLVNKRRTNQENYDILFNVLRGAYENETLHIGDPCGCGIGNLVREACGYTDKGKAWVEASAKWTHKFSTVMNEAPNYRLVIKEGQIARVSNETHTQLLNISLPGYQEDEANDQLRQIGLPMHHLMNLEWLFETNAYKGKDDDEGMFLGLMAMLDYLGEIFEIEQSVTQDRSKQLAETCGRELQIM